MPDLNPHNGSTKLFMAFDIGTTYSGVSYCICEPDQTPEIHEVARYPAQQSCQGDAKVPSLLYYDKSGDVRAAGAEALSDDTSEVAQAEGWEKAEWWKLHLRPSYLAPSVGQDGLPPLPPGKSAVNVLTDYVKYLFGCAKTYILERHPTFPWLSVEDSIEYIVTHPNGWEVMQRQLYRRAIAQAGLIPNTHEGQSRVHALTEGEACLYYCVARHFNMISPSEIAPHGVVIIDAGGGTIDLSMYSITSKPISCEEIAPAECQLQGTAFVTRRAKVLLNEKLHGWEKSSEMEISEYTREFDNSTKLVIKSDHEPAYVRVANQSYNSPAYNISSGKLKLSGAEATSLFSESIDAIISTFEEQQKSATIPIAMAFLVGGLSANDWVWSRLQAYFMDRNIGICRPDNHIGKAVANGAVLSLVDRNTHLIASRVARATYGVVCSLSVDDTDEQHIRRQNQWETDAAGENYVPGYFETKLRKGTHVREEMVFRESFSLAVSNKKDFGTQIIRLMCYRGKLSDPEWVDQDLSSFYTFCIIRLHLNEAVKDLSPKEADSGESYYELDYDVVLFFGPIELRAQLEWKTSMSRKSMFRVGNIFRVLLQEGERRCTLGGFIILLVSNVCARIPAVVLYDV